MPRGRHTGWRALLREHGPAFLAWLREEGVLDRVFALLADDLETYLLGLLDDVEIGNAFVEAIPDVLARCDEDIYNEPLRAEAFAFMHLLERYRRTWEILAQLVKSADLPLARYGVRALDVGTGPAPVPFAINDFYGSLRHFAGAKEIPALRLPDPELRSVEGAWAMQRFVHRFFEWARRTAGPFGAEWSDFAEFDPAKRRSRELATRVSQIAEEDETSESHARWWVDANEGYRQGAYTYRLCVFSNFLTTPEMVDRYQARLDAAFHAVTAGGVVLITGGVSGKYQAIYHDVEAKASAAGLRRLDLRTRFDPPTPDALGETIRRVRENVRQHLIDLGAVEGTPVAWSPTTPYKTSPFELRAFRRDGTKG